MKFDITGTTIITLPALGHYECISIGQDGTIDRATFIKVNGKPVRVNGPIKVSHDTIQVSGTIVYP